MKQLLQGRKFWKSISFVHRFFRKLIDIIIIIFFFCNRKLQPAFVPERRPEKRKTEPVFHDEILQKEAKKV